MYRIFAAMPALPELQCAPQRHSDTLPQYSIAFETEEAARVEAKKLIQQGYWGTIERHRQAKQDYEDDYGWLPDWNVPHHRAIELIDYF